MARITFNRPDKLNALRIKTFEELAAGLRLADEDETVGVVVVAGAGRAFCAGGDVEMAQTMLTSERAGRYHFFGRMMAASISPWRCRSPSCAPCRAPASAAARSSPRSPTS